MDPLVAEAVLEFGDDLRSARAAADEWADTRGLVHDGSKRRPRKPPERQQARTEANSRGRASAAAVVFIVIACD
jgi:hypothetical protein